MSLLPLLSPNICISTIPKIYISPQVGYTYTRNYLGACYEVFNIFDQARIQPV